MSLDNESDEGSSSTTATSSVNGDLPIRRTEIRYERRTPSPSFDRHTNVDLAALKSELRKMRNIAEEKDEEINEMRDELELKQAEILRVQDERLELVKEARAARDLRDELHMVQHKLLKLEKLEQDNAKLREIVVELEYYKSRSEQLRNENDSLEKTMALLEDEMEASRHKVKCQQEIECRLEESQESVHQLQSDIAEKNKRIEDMLCEQLKLEADLLTFNGKITELERLGIPTGTPRDSFGSLADQIEQSEKSELASLRLEIRTLKQRLQEPIEGYSTRDVSLCTESENADEIHEQLVGMSDLKEQLCNALKEATELREENDVINKQLMTVEKTLSSINHQYKECSCEMETIRVEKEEAVRNLHDARRKFAQFQSEIGKKFERDSENKTREVGIELSELRHRVTSSEEERNELTRQLERVRDDQKRLREQVDEESEKLRTSEIERTQIERSLKTAETERNAMKERCGSLEDELESVRIRLITTDDASRRLENSEKLLVEQQNRVGDVEAENRSLKQQLDLESKKTQRLREDLISEKTRLKDLMQNLRSLCTAVASNGGKIQTDVDDEKLIESIDEVLMGALSTAKREADNLRTQQQTQLAELVQLRTDIETLRRSESASLVESDDRVRELTHDNISIKEQVFLLQEKVRELHIEISAKNSEISSARKEIELLNRNSTAAGATNRELARLQVSLKNIQLQEELLKQDNSELRVQLELAEKSRQTAKKDADSLTGMHQALLADHDRLQQLHDLLTQDYERTNNDNQEMRTKLRNQRPSPVVMSTRELEELRNALTQERVSSERQMRSYTELHNEHGALKREFDSLRRENDSLSRNSEGACSELRRLRLADTTQRTTIKELMGTVDELTKELQKRDFEIAKLNNKIEMLSQLNRTYDEESKNLARQVEMLLNQNKDLLNRALSDKDQYHQEQKDFQEKMSALRRHKEKLEEKIMDQYRSMENKRFVERPKQPLVKRAAKALISRRRPSVPSTGSTTEDSSTYSADEGSSLNGLLKEDFDPMFPPTCSSSEDQDRISPRYENPRFFNEHSPNVGSPALRARNDVIGGSVRAYPLRTPMAHSSTFEQVTLNGPERAVDVPAPPPVSYLPPRAPVRNSSVTASLRARPPPPPYSLTKAKPPTPYSNHRVVIPNGSTTPVKGSPAPQFIPQMSSTPKSDRDEKNEREVVAEGEKRTFVREKEERQDKAMSIYENVSQAETVKGPNESTVWYEYGCV